MRKYKAYALGLSALLIILLVIWIKHRADPPNIVIIVMDTARQDRLSTYGYDRDTSPNLTELAERSRIYYNAYSTSGWTIPAHASLFTGLYPIVHKATQEDWKLGNRFTTIAEVLANEEYETIGIVGNGMLRRGSLFNQGFSKYYETWKKPHKSAGMKEDGTVEHPVYALFQDTLTNRNRENPFFVFINFIEPHSPYNSSRQFYDHFISDPSMTIESNMWPRHLLGTKIHSMAELQHLNELYDAEILYCDYLVGKIIDSLKEEGLWDQTIFIVTSDHGENIGDHDMMDHVFSLYETTTKIPLIIHYPKLFTPGTKDSSFAQLTDIFPTLLEIIGIDKNKHRSQGRNLLEKDVRDEPVLLTEYYYPNQALSAIGHAKENPMLDKFKRRIRSITFNDMKLIWGSDGRHELYDLANDPEETENLIDNGAHSALMEEMLTRLQHVVNSYAKDVGIYSNSQEDLGIKKEKLDEETLRELRSLGYVQ